MCLCLCLQVFVRFLFRYLSAVFLQFYHGPCERKSLCFACTFSRAWEVYAIGVSVSDAMHAHSVELGKSMPLGFLCVKLCMPIQQSVCDVMLVSYT